MSAESIVLAICSAGLIALIAGSALLIVWSLTVSPKSSPAKRVAHQAAVQGERRHCPRCGDRQEHGFLCPRCEWIMDGDR